MYFGRNLLLKNKERKQGFSRFGNSQKYKTLQHERTQKAYKIKGR